MKSGNKPRGELTQLELTASGIEFVQFVDQYKIPGELKLISTGNKVVPVLSPTLI